MAPVTVGATDAPPLALAIRSGLLALVSPWGGRLDDRPRRLAGERRADPATQSMSTYGDAGAMKDAHAVPMHAIQVFLALAWLLGFSGLRQRTQTWLVGLAVAGYAGLSGVVLPRTAGGLPSFVLDSASTVGYLLASGLLAATMLTAVVSVSRRRLARR